MFHQVFTSAHNWKTIQQCCTFLKITSMIQFLAEKSLYLQQLSKPTFNHAVVWSYKHGTSLISGKRWSSQEMLDVTTVPHSSWRRRATAPPVLRYCIPGVSSAGQLKLSPAIPLLIRDKVPVALSTPYSSSITATKNGLSCWYHFVKFQKEIKSKSFFFPTETHCCESRSDHLSFFTDKNKS